MKSRKKRCNGGVRQSRKYNKPTDDFAATDDDKQYIINRFRTNVKGIAVCLDGLNASHCGREGCEQLNHFLRNMKL